MKCNTLITKCPINRLEEEIAILREMIVAINACVMLSAMGTYDNKEAIDQIASKIPRASAALRELQKLGL